MLQIPPSHCAAGPIRTNCPSNITQVDVATSPTSSGAAASFEPAEHLLAKASTDSSKHITLLCEDSNRPTPQCDNSVTLPLELDFDDKNLDLDEAAEGNNFLVGRPSDAVLDMIQEGLDYIGTYLTDLATRTGQPPQQIVDRFPKQYARLIPVND